MQSTFSFHLVGSWLVTDVDPTHSAHREVFALGPATTPGPARLMKGRGSRKGGVESGSWGEKGEGVGWVGWVGCRDGVRCKGWGGVGWVAWGKQPTHEQEALTATELLSCRYSHSQYTPFTPTPSSTPL